MLFSRITCIVQLLPRQSPCSVAFCLPYSHCNTSFLQGYQCSGIHDEKQQGKNHSTEGCLLWDKKKWHSDHNTAFKNPVKIAFAQLLTSLGLISLTSYPEKSMLKKYSRSNIPEHCSPESLLDSQLINMRPYWQN